MKARLYNKYVNDVVPALKAKNNYRNVHQVPRLEKIVVNMGVGEAITDIKILEKSSEELGLIAGQKPLFRRAKKAIAN